MNRRAVLLALLVACARPRPPRVVMEASFWLHGDTRFLPHERAAFEEAIRRWNVHTRGRVALAVAWDLDDDTLIALKDEPRIVRVEEDDARTRAVDARLGAGRARAFTRPAGDGLPIIVCVVHARVRDWLATAMHEIGHVVGLPEGYARGVMLVTNPGTEFTANDDELIDDAGLLP